MPAMLQIALGSGVLLVCAVLHTLVITRFIDATRDWRAHGGNWLTARSFRLVIVAFGVVLASHTAQIYLWALAVWVSGALADFQDAIYFSLVSYTTVGYGDLILGDDYRIFGALSGVVGILAFGMSTAFLVGLFSRLYLSGPSGET